METGNTVEERIYLLQKIDSKLSDHEGRLRDLERGAWDSKQITQAIRWVTIVLGSSLITLIGSFVFERVAGK